MGLSVKLLKSTLFTCILSIQLATYAQTATDTFHIYFDLDVPELNKDAKQTLDSLLYYDVINPGSFILISGFADYLGTEASNEVLSEKRAQNTREYLLNSGIDSKHIKSTIGKGEIARTVQGSTGYAEDRKVDIIIGKDNRIFTDKPAKTEPPATTGKKENYITRKIDSLKVGQTFRLENIFFYTGRHTVREESMPELDKLFEVLTDNPALRIQIEGHVCCVPDDKDALDEDINPGADNTPTPYSLNRLSLNRAMYIYYYLVKKGINSSRMKYEGYGRSRPLINIEKSLADEDMNKRVEIRILAK